MTDRVRPGVVAALLVVLGGCAPIGIVMEARARGEGIKAEYPVSLDQAWNISKSVFQWADAEIVGEYKHNGYMLATVGTSAFSFGSHCGAWFEPASSSHTAVTIVTKRRMGTNIVGGLTDMEYHQMFSKAVAIIKSGKPLPKEAPE